mmetsp:Transcript_25239/g.43466  ORF Transcript_25239/g.43466 Transcript_25239/m.43466 type:complete len:673 (-) Transcript_25239:3-2021(-)
MEFERAIYRVYERCLEGLREDQDVHGNASMKSCKFLELLSLCFGTFMLMALVFLHSEFVGTPGCLPDLLSGALAPLNQTYDSDYPYLKYDQVLYITIDKRFQPQKELDDSEANSQARSSHNSLSEISTASMVSPFQASQRWFSFGAKAKKHGYVSKGPQFSGNSLQNDRQLRGGILPLAYTQYTTLNDTALPILTLGNSTEGGSNTDSTDPVEPEYDYKFTFNSALLLLPYAELKAHQFTTVNVSLLGTACYGGSVSQSMIPLGGVDTVVVNALMYTLRQPGHVFTSAGDYFRWNDQDLVPYRNVPEWFQFKLQILFYSLFAFFFLTTITALLVRILISSGVVLIFPIFWVLQWFGFAPLNLRIVAISYPWIGIPLEMIRSRNQSITPFVLGHISRVVVYYFLYQATQLVFAVWFYNRDSPGQQELWIFGLMMLWEYFSMIYVRSTGSIQLFPRASLALFLIYHFYYFSFPSGFHVLALVTMFFFLLALMVHCIRVYEMKDYERGIISLDQPRALYNSLPWPVWNADLAPEFTLMMPVSHRATGAYNTAIPAVPGGGFQAGVEGNGAGNAIANNGTNGAVAGNNTSGAGAGGATANANSVTNPLQTSSSDSQAGVELNTLRSVTATTSTTTSSNNNNQNNSTRSNMTYSRLNSSSTHGDADGDEERGSGAVV